MSNYVAYHTHTEYSLLDSATKAEEYIERAVSLGQKAIAFSEHGNIRGWTKKKVACDKDGIKYIHAVEVYLTRALVQETDDGFKKLRDNYHTILIAKNYAGVKEINRLVSMSTDENHMHYVGRITFDEFLHISSNVITTSACLASPLNKLDISDPYYEKLIARYDYLEIQPHASQDQKDYNVHLASLAKRYGKPLIAATDAHSANAYKNECRDILMDYKGQHYDGEDEMDLVYKSYDELCDAFRIQDALPESIWMEAIENTNTMADSVEEFTLDTSIKYPIMYGSPEEDEKKFVENVWSSLDEKLSSGVIPKSQESAYRSALQEEIDVFHKTGMCGFMQTESEIIRWCHDNGIMTGPARGSVAGSRAAYVTDIIDLNPETWSTVFSRFANESRVEVGDIDTDMMESDRPAVFKYIIDRFGVAKTARVPSYGTCQDKKCIEIIVGAFRKRWEAEHPELSKEELRKQCPYSLDEQDVLKKEFAETPDKFRKKHPKFAYYVDGLLDVKISQSVHPAGIVVSPITLADNYGVFRKDKDIVLQIDMDEIHDNAGLVKYDMLILRNIGIIKDACKLAGIPYPKSHEIDWNDQAVWEDMIKSPVGIFQMEGEFAFRSLKQFNPKSIEDMSLVTASIRPSGESYRNDLLSRKVHRNQSNLIDNLLKENLGYLVYQEDIIAFLQQICGLSGSEADTVRRGIAGKKMAILEKMMPKILDGYCKKSDKPRDVAEQEAQEYIKVIEDASAYMFGKNHSIGYCLVGYLCAYLRYYHPYEFVTSLLNNAANDDDISSATELASQLNIEITPPRYGISMDEYGFDRDTRQISKGAASIKYMNKSASIGLYKLCHEYDTSSFSATLCEIHRRRIADERQIELLIKIDYFSKFGNVSELMRIFEFCKMFKYGESKSYRCDKCGEVTGNIIKKYASNIKKDGTPGASYRFNDAESCLQFLMDCEKYILSLSIKDVDLNTKVKYQQEYLGYIAIQLMDKENARRLYVSDVKPVISKKNNRPWTYRISVIRLYTGKQADVYINPVMYDRNKIAAGDIIEVASNGIRPNKNGYYNMYGYTIVA